MGKGLKSGNNNVNWICVCSDVPVGDGALISAVFDRVEKKQGILERSLSLCHAFCRDI